MHIGKTAGNHATLGAVNYQARELGPWPDLQVAGTVDVMRDRAREDAQGEGFKVRAKEIAGAGCQLDRVGNLYEHVQRSIRFSRDEPIAQALNSGGEIDPDDVVEVIIRPVDMAAYIDKGIAVGDCDDFSMYLAALLLANGIGCGFVTVAADERAPGQYSHVYVVAYPDGVRVACDASHGEYPGWEVPNAFGKIREWGVSGGVGVGIGIGVTEIVVASVVGSFAAWWLWKKAGGGQAA